MQNVGRRPVRIAEGGMGYVELCARGDGPSLGWAARKRLHPHLRSDPAFHVMFMDEGRLASAIRHPNVVEVSEVGADDEGPYLVMDYVEGLPLCRVPRPALDARDAAAGRASDLQGRRARVARRPRGA